jgi:hypothetical protein
MRTVEISVEVLGYAPQELLELLVGENPRFQELLAEGSSVVNGVVPLPWEQGPDGRLRRTLRYDIGGQQLWAPLRSVWALGFSGSLEYLDHVTLAPDDTAWDFSVTIPDTRVPGLNPRETSFGGRVVIRPAGPLAATASYTLRVDCRNQLAGPVLESTIAQAMRQTVEALPQVCSRFLVASVDQRR